MIGRAAQAAARTLHLPIGPDPAALMEWRRLRADPVFRGVGVPRHEGAAILLVGGFGAPARVMAPLRSWLERIGYAPRVADVRRGIDCAERTAQLLEEQIEELAAEMGMAVLLVAHSRGGQFARVAVRRKMESTAGLITLGTPFELFALHPTVKAQAALLGVVGTAGVPGLLRLSCLRGECCAPFRRDLASPWSPEIPFASVYSRKDRTVRWMTCIDPAAENIEVATSHTGMLVSPEVYRAIATFAARISAAAATRQTGGGD